MPGPLTVDPLLFAALLEKFAPLSARIAVAVSGGPDSMALAFCVKRWAKCDAVALIVDHALRPESASEAQQTRTRLEQLGMQAEILVWAHAAITHRLHEQARAARYDLLTAACRRLGIGDLLLAHHREDQAETILMRLTKASASGGLAGMADAVTRGDIRILRPFLSLSKQNLIDTCDAAHIDYVRDPGNASDKFKRGRLRRLAPLLAAEGLTTDALIELGARAAETATAIDAHARQFLSISAQLHQGGFIRLDRAALQHLPRATALRALSLCLRHIHEGDYPPPRASLNDLLDRLSAPNPPAACSLHGCLISLGADHLSFLREPAAAIQKLAIENGQTLLWDDRWLVSLRQESPEPLTVAALGTQPHATLDRLAPGLRHTVAQGRVRATLPALWHGDALHAIPSFDPASPLHAVCRKQAFL